MPNDPCQPFKQRKTGVSGTAIASVASSQTMVASFSIYVWSGLSEIILFFNGKVLELSSEQIDFMDTFHYH